MGDFLEVFKKTLEEGSTGSLENPSTSGYSVSEKDRLPGNAKKQFQGSFLDVFAATLKENEAKKLQAETAANAQKNLAGRSEFTRGLLRGIDTLQATYEGGVGMYNAAIGDQAAADRRFANYREQMRQASENPGTVTDFFSTDEKTGAFASPSNFGTYVAGTLGQAVPSLTEAVISGIAGAAVGAAIVPAPDPADVVTVPAGAIGGFLGRNAMRRAIASAAQQYASRGMAQDVAEQTAERYVRQAVANRIAANVGSGLAVSQTTALHEGGGMWAEGMEKGYNSPYSAIGLGQVSGFSEALFGSAPAAVRAILGKSAVDEAAKTLGWKQAAGYAWDVIKNSGEEGVQEAFQEYLGAINQSINDPKFNLYNKENFMQWAEAAAAGAITGGVVGGGSVSLQAIRDRQRQLEEIQSKGFVSESDAQEAGIEGASRRERMANLEAERQELDRQEQELAAQSDQEFIQQQQSGQIPAGQLDEAGGLIPQVSQEELDREFAARVAAQGGNVTTPVDEETPASFAARMARGEPITSLEDQQYRMNNAAAIEEELQKILASGATSTASPQPTAPAVDPFADQPAPPIADSQDPFADQQQPAATPPSAEQPTPLYEVAGDENMVARVWPNPNGFLVNLTDMDSGEVDTRAMIFPTFEQAMQHADTVRLPVQQPQVQPSVTSEDPFAEQQPAPVEAPEVPVVSSPEQHAALPMYGVYETTFRGERKFSVKEFENQGAGDALFDSLEEANKYSLQADRRNQEQVDREQKAKADDELAAKKQRDYEASFGGFLSADPKTKGRQLKVLGGSRQYNGKVVTVKDIIEQKIAGGAVVNASGQLESPDGAYLGSDKITKIGIDYARHLLASKAESEAKPETQDERGTEGKEPDALEKTKRVFAVMTSDGVVHSDPNAKMHYDVIESLGLDPNDIIDGGFIEDGKYRMSMSDGGYAATEGEPEQVAVVRKFADAFNAEADQQPKVMVPSELKIGQGAKPVPGLEGDEANYTVLKRKPDGIPDTFKVVISGTPFGRGWLSVDGTGATGEEAYRRALENYMRKRPGELRDKTRKESIRKAIDEQGGFENNSADDVEAIRRKLYDGADTPTGTEIRAVMDEMKLEAGRKLESEQKAPEPEQQPAPQGKTEGFRLLPEKSRNRFEELWNANDTSIKDVLDLTNKNLRAEFEARTGLTLPKTKKGTAEVVEKWHSEGRKLADETQPKVSDSKPKPPTGYKPLEEFTPVVTQTLSPDLELEENRQGIKELALKQGEAVGYRVYPKRGSTKGGYWQYGTVRYEPSGSHASIERTDGTIESVGGSRLVRLEPVTAMPTVEQPSAAKLGEAEPVVQPEGEMSVEDFVSGFVSGFTAGKQEKTKKPKEVAAVEAVEPETQYSDIKQHAVGITRTIRAEKGGKMLLLEQERNRFQWSIREIGSKQDIVSGISELKRAKAIAERVFFGTFDKDADLLFVLNDTNSLSYSNQRLAGLWDGRTAESFAATLVSTGYYTDGRMLVKLSDKDRDAVLKKAGTTGSGRIANIDAVIAPSKQQSSYKDNEMSVVGYRGGERTPRVVMLKNKLGDYAILDKAYHDTVIKRHPAAKIWGNSEKKNGNISKAVFYEVEGEAVAVVMPMTVEKVDKYLSAMIEGKFDAAEPSPPPAPPKKPKSLKKEPKQGVKEGLDKAKEGAKLFIEGIKDAAKGNTPFANIPMNEKIARGLGMMAEGLVEAGKYKFVDFIDSVVELVGAQNARNYAKYLEAGWSKIGETDSRLDKPQSVLSLLEAKETKSERQQSDGGTSPNIPMGDGAGERQGDAAATGDANAEGRDSQEVSGQSGDLLLSNDGKDSQLDGRGIGDRVGADGNSDSRGSEQGPADAIDSGRGEADGAVEDRLANNHVIGPDDSLAVSSVTESLNRNIKALEILKKLESSGKFPDESERKALAQYTGWGGLSQALDSIKGERMLSEDWRRDDNWEQKWGKAYVTIKDLLTKEEFQAAQESTENAHYTSKEIVQSLWKIADRLGYNGGRVLELGAGVGHFAGLTPSRVRGITQFTMVERDSVSSRIAKMLYPGHEVVSGDMEEFKAVPGSVTMGIGNVPFAGGTVNDSMRRYSEPLNLHNYSIARHLDAVAPGGVVVVISSHSTLDANIKQRQFLASKGELIGAIRLPNDAFAENAKTEVVTDILVFRRPRQGDGSMGFRFDQNADVTVKDKSGNDVTKTINKYFVDNPEMVLGRHSAKGSMYGPDEYTVESTPGSLKEKLDAAIERLPKNILGKVDVAEKVVSNDATIPFGRLEIRDGNVVMGYGDKFVSIAGKSFDDFPVHLTGKTGVARAKDYIALRDILADTRQVMLAEESTDEDVTKAQKKLSDSYDKYVAKHGPLNTQKTNIFVRDPDYYRVLALENERGEYNPATKKIDITYEKAAIFRKRVLGPRKEPESAGSPADAMSISIAWRGAIDSVFIGKLLGLSPKEAESKLLDKGLAFRNPSTTELEMSDLYLSGNVRAKLEQAKISAEEDSQYERNVEALAKVLPEPVSIKKDTVRLGAAWIPENIIQAFATQAFGTDIRVSYNANTDAWTVQRAYGLSEAAKQRYKTDRLNPDEILEETLNLRSIKVYDSVETGEFDSKGRPKKTQVLNEKETQAAKHRASVLRADFEKWVLETPDVNQVLAKLYNDKYNNFVRTKYNGDFLVLPGSNPEVKLRPYQKDAIWRIINRGTALLAHAVGGGKTYTMIGSAMEMRRLGLARRPLLVVQNATLGQFATSFQKMYPNANVLVATKEDLGKGKRQLFLNKITTGNWDAVVMAQSTFDNMASDPDVERAFIQDQLDLLEEAIREEGGESAKTPTTKQLVRTKRSLKNRFDSLMGSRAKKEDNVIFEDLGADALFLDEAHAYKKPTFTTKLSSLVGLNTESSARSLATTIKVRSVQSQHNGRNVILATGTPVTNTLGEAWHMVNYVSPATNAAFSSRTFDQFIGNFAQVEPTLTMNAGGQYVYKDAIVKFRNGHQLVEYINDSWDIVTPDALRAYMEKENKAFPKLRDGKLSAITVDRTPGVAAFMDYIDRVYQRYKSLPAKQRRELSFIPALAYGAAKAATLDIRLVMPNAAEEKNSKLQIAANEIKRIYDESSAVKGAQLFFSDMKNPFSMSRLRQFMAGETIDAFEEDVEPSDGDVEVAPEESDSGSFLYQELKKKLLSLGIPSEQIAFISDAKTDKQRQALFQRVNNGDIRVLIGSTAKMGVGVNVQEKLVALHHFDTPWLPADLEQREGRILRFGNTNAVVEILRYAMKKTLDGAIYMSTARKQKFIWQVLNGQLDGDSFDDPSSATMLSIEEQLAAIQDDPIFFEKIEVQNRLRELELERQSFFDAQQRVAESLRQYESDLRYKQNVVLPKLTERLKRINDVKLRVEEAGGSLDSFKAEIDGRLYTDPKKADEAIKAKLEESRKHVSENFNKLKTIEKAGGILSLSGKQLIKFSIGPANVAIGLEPAYLQEKNDEGKDVTRAVARVNSIAYLIEPGGDYVFYAGNATVPATFFEKMGQIPKNVESDISFNEERISYYKEKIEELKSLMGKQWEDESEYQEKRSRLSEIESLMLASGSSISDKKPDDSTVDEQVEKSDLDDGLSNPPDVLYQTEPDIDATIRSKALDLGIAANKQGITHFDDFIAYSVRTVGESETRRIGNYLTMVGKTVGMQGVRPTKAVLGVPMTQDEYTQLAKETFASVPAEQVEAGIEAAMATGLPQMAVGFSPAGTPVPSQGLMQDNFDQPPGYDFNESDFRPAVVAYAKNKWGDAIAPNGKPTWQNFVRWFGDSAVVDWDGKPRVVYHGSKMQFDEFKPEFFERETNWSFSSEIDVAKTYQPQIISADKLYEIYIGLSDYYKSRFKKEVEAFIDNESGNVDKATVEAWVEEANYDNPQLWAGDLARAIGMRASAMYGASSEGQMVAAYLRLNNPIKIWMNDKYDEVKRVAPDGKHDGYIFYNVMDTNFPQEARITSTVYKVLESNQIKSATGNVGTFDPNSPSMLMQQEPVSRINMNYKDVTKRIPQLTEASQKLNDGEITKDEYAAIVERFKPVAPYRNIPKPATTEDAKRALPKFKFEKFGDSSEEIPAGYTVELRLDINAYKLHDVWINSIHRKVGGKEVTQYDSYAYVTDVDFVQTPGEQGQALDVARGARQKGPFARIEGKWKPVTKEQAVAMAEEALRSAEWTQVGYDPERHGYFYDRYDHRLVLKSADEVVQIGPLVLAKNPVYGDRSDVLFQGQSQGGNVKGWTKFISGTRALIGATSKADVSTVIHEFAHPIRRFLLDKNVPQSKRADITDEEISMLEEKCGVKNGNWDVAAEEKFARMWEQYWFEGKSPNSVLDSLFEKISRWMRGVYQSIQQITGGQLDPEVRKLFDKLVQRGLSPEQRSAPIGAEQETSPPVPMAHEDELTSNANAVAEETRAILGIKGYADPARESFQQWIDEAKSLLRQDPTLGERLRAELSKKARSLTKVEEAVLSIHLRHIKNLIDRTSDRLFAAKDANDSVAAAQALRETDMLVNQFEELTDAINRSGSETARALVARKIALRSDFTQGNLLRMARIANGGKKLDKEQTEEIIALSRKVAELEGQLEKKTQEAEDLERKLAVEQAIDGERKQTGGKARQSTLRKKAAEKAVGLAKKLSGIFVRSTATDTLQQTEDEQLAGEAADVIKAYVDAGVYSFGEFMSKFKKDIGMEVPVSARATFSTVWAEMREQGDIPTPQMLERDVAQLRKIAELVMRSLIEDGITDPEEVIDGVHESLQEIIPYITKREAMDAMSGYGQYTPPSKDPVDRIVRDLKAQYQQMAKKDDMEKGEAPKRSGRGRDEPSPALRKLIREVNEMKRTSKYFITDKELQLRSVVQSIRTSLLNRIRDLDEAIKTETPITKKTEVALEGDDAKEIADLRKRRDELMAEYKRTFPKPGATFEQRAAAAERAADRAIAEIEKEIASGKMIVKGRPEPISTPALNAKLARLDALKAAREAAFESQIKEREEQRAEKAYIANLLAKIADYEDRKRQGYFEPRAKKERRKLSPQEIELSRQLVDLKDEFFRLSAEYRLANMGRVEKAWDNTKETMHLSRAIMTSFDLSAVFRQGGIASLAHPRLSLESAREMRAAIFSQNAEFKSIDDIEKDSLYSFAMQCGLPITTNKGKIERQEEAYMGRLVRYGIGKKGTKLNKFTLWALKPIAASSRAYTVYLNTMRFRLFKYLVSNLGVNGEVTLDEGRVIATYVGVATGRAELGKFNQAAANLNTVFFAPRYVASRFQYLAMPFYLLPSTKVSGRVKKMIAMEYARHAMGLAAFLGLSVALASLLTDDEEEKPTVELDPRSSDFMKLRIGETRIDPMAGLSQTITLIGQLSTGQKKKVDGEIQDLYGKNRKFGDPDLWDVTTGFIRKKLAPIPGAIVDLRVGENVIGEKETPITVATDLFIPLAAQEVGETMKARGLVGGLGISALSLLGMGGGTYGPRTAYATADKAKRLELFNKDLDSVKWDSKDPVYSDFLTVDEIEKFKKKREQRKQSLAYAASADPKRKEHASEESFKQSVSERDKAMETLMKSGMTFSEVRQLLIDYYRRNYGSAYETVGGIYGMKKSLVNRLRQIRSKMGQVPAAN